MYRAYFKLKENPFTTSPDPRFFYLAPSHEESVAKCEYAIRNKSGLAVVYGDVGTGKTTILNKLRERFGSESFTIAVMNNPNQISDTALLKAIAAEFGLRSPRTKQGTFDQFTGNAAAAIFGQNPNGANDPDIGGAASLNQGTANDFAIFFPEAAVHQILQRGGK